MQGNEGSKVGTLLFYSDGKSVEVAFHDQVGRSVDVPFDFENFSSHAPKLIERLVLLMQRRNRVINFDADGAPVPECTVNAEVLAEIVAHDSGSGW